MLQQLKFSSKDFRKIWILSDLHLGQTSGVILKGRGFQTMEEHDAFIRKYWMENISNQDLVINLGDSNFQDPSGDFFREFAKWPAKRHIFLWGNHVSGAKQEYLKLCYSITNEAYEIYPLHLDNITFVGNNLEAKIDNQWIVFSHFPYAIFNNCLKGFISLCGHSHNTFPQTRLESKAPRILDCGVESALSYSQGQRPFFQWEEIKEIMSWKHHESKDGHH